MNDFKGLDLPEKPVIVWFRNDLRVSDNMALTAAAQTGNPVIPLYVLEKDDETVPLGGAQEWWLHHSLASLSNSLERLGAPLVLRRGEAANILKEIVDETGAGSVLWNRRYVPAQIKRDAALKSDLRDSALTVESFDGQLLHEPTQLKTGSGGPYRVYTPFWRSFSESCHPRLPIGAPKELAGFKAKLVSDDLKSWSLLPTKPY